MRRPVGKARDKAKQTPETRPRQSRDRRLRQSRSGKPCVGRAWALSRQQHRRYVPSLALSRTTPVHVRVPTLPAALAWPRSRTGGFFRLDMMNNDDRKCTDIGPVASDRIDRNKEQTTSTGKPQRAASRAQIQHSRQLGKARQNPIAGTDNSNTDRYNYNDSHTSQFTGKIKQSQNI